MSETSPCYSGVPPVSHPDGCKPVMKSADKVDNAIGDNGGDKATIYDNALAGCLADGCHHHGTGFFPFVHQGDAPQQCTTELIIH